MSGFRLDRRSAAMRGGRDPNDIVPGSSATSHLYVRLIGDKYPQMPPTGRLGDEAIATLKAWLDQGARWPDELANEPIVAPVDPRAATLMAAIRDRNRHISADRNRELSFAGRASRSLDTRLGRPQTRMV